MLKAATKPFSEIVKKSRLAFENVEKKILLPVSLRITTSLLRRDAESG
jgi:hypothetical protein